MPKKPEMPEMPEMSESAHPEKQRTDEDGAGGMEGAGIGRRGAGIGQKLAEKREQKSPFVSISPASPVSLTAGETQAEPDPLPEQPARGATVTTVAATGAGGGKSGTNRSA